MLSPLLVPVYKPMLMSEEHFFRIFYLSEYAVTGFWLERTFSSKTPAFNSSSNVCRVVIQSKMIFQSYPLSLMKKIMLPLSQTSVLSCSYSSAVITSEVFLNSHWAITEGKSGLNSGTSSNFNPKHPRTPHSFLHLPEKKI